MTRSAPLVTDAAAAARESVRTTVPEQPGERRYHFELAPHPGSAAHARRLTRDRLDGWAICADTRETAELVVSELVTNAIVHTASRRIVCELQDEAGTLRIAVRDEGCTASGPRPWPQRPKEEHGRGLLLVSAVCSSWGAQETGPGLLVWAELPGGRASGERGSVGTSAGRAEGQATVWA